MGLAGSQLGRPGLFPLWPSGALRGVPRRGFQPCLEQRRPRQSACPEGSGVRGYTHLHIYVTAGLIRTHFSLPAEFRLYLCSFFLQPHDSRHSFLAPSGLAHLRVPTPVAPHTCCPPHLDGLLSSPLHIQVQVHLPLKAWSRCRLLHRHRGLSVSHSPC